MLTDSPRRILVSIVAWPLILLALIATARAFEPHIAAVSLPHAHTLGAIYSDMHDGASHANPHRDLSARGDAPATVAHSHVEGSHPTAARPTTNHDYEYYQRTNSARQAHRGENPVSASTRPISATHVVSKARFFALSPEFVAAKSGPELTTVGRWMSQAEHKAMQTTGRVQEGAGCVTSVARPASADAYMAQAASRSRYVEFDVPSSALSSGGKEGWASIRGPNSWWAGYGKALPEMPSASNLNWIMSRL